MSDSPHKPVPMIPSSTSTVSPPVKRDYHTHEWTSGTRGGGKVPADLEWRTNPKQWQEENGAALPENVSQGPASPQPALTSGTEKK